MAYEGVRMKPLLKLLMTAMKVVKRMNERQLSPDTWDEEERAYVLECNPELILQLILVAVAAKEMVDNPNSMTGEQVKDAVSRIWGGDAT